MHDICEPFPENVYLILF